MQAVPGMGERASCTTINRSGSGDAWIYLANQTILHAEPARSECSKHGVRVVKVPWTEPFSRFTALCEGLAIEWLKAASKKAGAGLLQISWDELHGIMERAVKRGLERQKAEPVSQIDVDEKASGQNVRQNRALLEIGVAAQLGTRGRSIVSRQCSRYRRVGINRWYRAPAKLLQGTMDKQHLHVVSRKERDSAHMAKT